MSALKALRTARAAGVNVTLSGDNLALEASSPPPNALLEDLSRNKADIIALLRTGADRRNAEDWLIYFKERAGVAGFVGGLHREQAEAQAFKCCVAEWMNRNPQTSLPDRCLGCGCNETDVDPLLPFSCGTHGHSWLHARCWEGWFESRKAEAVLALVAMGIKKPANFENDLSEKGAA